MVAAGTRAAIGSAATIVARVVAAVLGNYAASSAAGAVLAVLFARGGMARADAVVAASIVTILGYLVMLIWAFHTPRLGRLWMILIGVAIACTSLTHLIGPAA